MLLSDFPRLADTETVFVADLDFCEGERAPQFHFRIRKHSGRRTFQTEPGRLQVTEENEDETELRINEASDEDSTQAIALLTRQIPAYRPKAPAAPI
jgi:hypothetical protein